MLQHWETAEVGKPTSSGRSGKLPERSNAFKLASERWIRAELLNFGAVHILGSSLMREAVLCTVGIWQHPWPLLTRC